MRWSKTLLGDGLVVHELLAAREIGLGESEIGARLSEIGAHLFERDLERPPVDGEEEIALLHQLAVGEVDFGKIAREARAHFDRIDGDEAADIFVLVDDRALLRLRHRYGRRRRWSRLLLLALPQPARAESAAAIEQGGGQARRINDGHKVSLRTSLRPHHM